MYASMRLTVRGRARREAPSVPSLEFINDDDTTIVHLPTTFPGETLEQIVALINQGLADAKTRRETNDAVTAALRREASA
jgi:hypothetical protein